MQDRIGPLSQTCLYSGLWEGPELISRSQRNAVDLQSVFLKVSMYVCLREGVKVPWRPAEGVGTPGTEPPDVGAGNQTSSLQE